MSHTKLTDEERKTRRVKSVVDWRVRTKQKLVEYKGGKCIKCGYKNYFGNLTFHHKDPSQKTDGIQSIITARSQISSKWSSLKEELKKCKVFCANCHRKFHYKDPVAQLD